MTKKNYINRELSWIDFNERVLSEAEREDVPLLERVKFLAIVSSNFNEFMMVRIANLLHEVEWGDHVSCPSGNKPSVILKRALKRVKEVKERQYRCLTERIYPALEKIPFPIMDFFPDTGESEFYRTVFQERIQPILTPLGSPQEGLFDYNLIKKEELHLYIQLQKMDTLRDLILPIPANLPRFFPCPDREGAALVEAVVFHQLDLLFPGEKVVDRGIFRILRDADLTVDEKRDQNFMKAMEELLQDRIDSTPIILEYSLCSEAVRTRLLELLQIPEERCFEMNGPLRLKDFFSLIPLIKKPGLLFPEQKAQRSPVFSKDRSPWEVLLERDVLLHHPFESFHPVLQLIQNASEDPDVMAIKMTLYRTSGDSPLIHSLLEAAKSGKQVTVLVELKARFDESQNIRWARTLARAGVMVVYGVAGLKVHAKALLIIRREREGIRRYLHLGTGNYNDKTAKLYTDFSYMTSREELTEEASSFFNAITGYSDPPEFKYLAMAPFTLRTRLVQLIEREMVRAEEGEDARFIAKINSLNDPAMVELLYRASQAGVKIELNVRGICAVVPGISGLSENIRVVSVIGRYLEHSRCYYFLNGGQEEVFLSSADWMPRNLDRRVELLFPVVDRDLRLQVKQQLEYAMSDNRQGHELQSDHSWKRVEGTPARDSQSWAYHYYKERNNVVQKVERDRLEVRRTPPGV